MNQNKEVRVDPIVVHLGDLGRYQLYFCLIIFMSKFPSGWVQISHIFLTGKAEYRCIDPGANVKACSSKCHKGEFDRSVFSETIDMTFDLKCDTFWLSSLSQTFAMLGVMIGSIVFGLLSDRYGRYVIFCSSCTMQLITGVIASFSVHYAMFVIFRFLDAAATGGQMTISFVLIMEIVGASKRELLTILYQLPFNVGHASLPLFSYFLRDWRWFHFSFSIVSVLYLLYWYLLFESPRWLFTTGRLDKAIAIIERVARKNGMPTENIAPQIEEAYKRLTTDQVKAKGTFRDLFRSPNMCKKTIIMVYQWFSVAMVFYGTAQYISTLSGNIFLNVFISGALGIPGTIICVFTSKYLGRRLSLFISSLLSAVAFLIIACCSTLSSILVVVCAIIGLFGASVTFPNLYLYAGEIFPTVVRSSGIGTCSSIARIGSMLAPFISSDLSRMSPIIPPLTYCIISAIGCATTFFLPETRGYPIPETVEEGENFGKRRPPRTD